jgi:hypothetical protein
MDKSFEADLPDVESKIETISFLDNNQNHVEPGKISLSIEKIFRKDTLL